MRARFFWVAVSVSVVACTKFGEERAPVEAVKAPLVCKAPPLREGKARMKNAFPALTFEEPVRLVRAGSRWFVAERGGKIRAFDDRADVAETTVVLDLAAAGQLFVFAESDGLLGLAFHPRFAENGEAFVSYTAPSSVPGVQFTYRVDRVRSTDGGKTFDAATLERVFAFPRDQAMHHGGPIGFGSDGMLYVATGDGFYGDPNGDAQNLGSPRGKILRVDVDVDSSRRPYAVPTDNPFVGRTGALPEIWALGFRNPYGMWLDPLKNDLWVGDVGHFRYEEIDLVTRGGNYGWRVREGKHCFGQASCATDGLVDPVFEYDHGEGFCVTAGFVYRGSAFPAARESFVFGDFVTGRVSTLRDGRAEILVESGRLPSHFAESKSGEILVLDYGTGTIQEVVPEDRVAVLPKTLSETGCFDPKDGRVADSLWPYEINMELWSDGAAKQRWLMLPEGKKIKVLGSGNWDPAPGSIVFKTFSIDGKKVETRMLVNHEEGGWAGYSYAWNDAQDEAVLLDKGETRDVGGGRTWTYPSRSDCFACHNLASGRVLGLHGSQINRNGQIERLEERDLFDGVGWRPALSDGRDEDSVEARGRSYLAVNCGNCHRSSGPAAGLGDFRIDMEFETAKLCNVRVQSGAEGGIRLVPGDPDASAIIQRMRAHDGSRMPPLGSKVVDERGVKWVGDWIRSIPVETCPNFSPIGP